MVDDEFALWSACADYFVSGWTHLEHLVSSEFAEASQGESCSAAAVRMLAEFAIFLEIGSGVEAIRTVHGQLKEQFEEFVSRLDWDSVPATGRALLPRAAIAWTLRDSGRAEVMVTSAMRSLEPHSMVGEVRPVVEMAARYLRSKIKGELPVYQDLVPQSVLGRRGDLSQLTRSDLYDVTHWIFYLTDFGRLAELPKSTPLDVASWLRRTLPGAVEAAAAGGDSDLLAELVACEFVIWPKSSSRLDSHWVELRTEAISDRFRRPRFSTTLYATLPPGVRERYRFRHHYHTYIAVAIAATAKRAQIRSSRG